MFQAIITNNTRLTNVEKFQYLRSSLSGDAADTIESLELSEVNFQVAWNLLERRYDKLRVIVQAHIQSILEIPAIKKESYTELRQLVSVTTKNINALKALKRPVDDWNDLIVHILANKLDPVTFHDWEDTLTGHELPHLEQLVEFLMKKCQTLESIINKESASAVPGKSNQSNSRKTAINCVASVASKCSYCNGEHPIYFCQSFAKLPAGQRVNEVKKRRLCANCLKSKSHQARQCLSSSCKTCGLKHNTLLHLNKPNNDDFTTKEPPTSQGSKDSSSSHATVTHNLSTFEDNYVLLSTALVDVFDHNNSKLPCRVLLDSGSQANLITRDLVSKLRIRTEHHNMSIVGISQIAISSNEIVTIKIKSRYNKFQTVIQCLVTDRITDLIPRYRITKEAIKFPKNIQLADPKFNVPSQVQVLIGADLFWQLLCVGQIKPTFKGPTIQKTQLGWIIAGGLGKGLQNKGKAGSSSVNITLLETNQSNANVDNALTRFWQLENEFTDQNHMSPIERRCEEHFLRTVKRNENGRFIVSLPIKPDGIQQIGESRQAALARFNKLEKRFKYNKQLREGYSKFMREYIELNHMRAVEEPETRESKVEYYLPHHAVFKETSNTTKLRVVFDGSCKSNSGSSINDILMIGPVVQPDLTSILLKFRKFRYVFTADIIKMYRQILICTSQTSLQRILWRFDDSEPVTTYELVTLTYGLSSSSYLATRCLDYLAEIYANTLPLGAEALEDDTHIDDVLSGDDSIEKAIEKRDQIITLLKSAQFELSKWSANHPQLLSGLSQPSSPQDNITIDKESESRILGMQWNPLEDTFKFTIKVDTTNSKITKRTMLAEISQLFDPLGLVGPVILTAKLLIQELWKNQMDWDSTVPMNIHTQWKQFKSQLHNINELKIKRYILPEANVEEIQVHGFADASQSAYGACIYIRTQDATGIYQTRLLISKSRIAPMKTVTLPRLELCAAVLLAQLMEKVVKSIKLPNARKFLWSDSKIVLSWIKALSRKWETFVANRVGEIQRLTEVKDWRHVDTESNPADIISRGASPSELIKATLWWEGPNWLKVAEEDWPESIVQCTTLPEKVVNILAVKLESPILDALIDKYSKLQKLVRVLAYIFRFINNAKTTSEKRDTLLTPKEYEASLHFLCKFVQRQEFASDIGHLERSKSVPANSKLLSLNPFLDEEGILRVGGRLRNTNLAYESRHPILLPKNHTITKLIIHNEHIRNMHTGVQATLYAVRNQFWPIAAKTTARDIIRRCAICWRAKPPTLETVMSDLPSSRVRVSRPFTYCGVDFGGPFLIREHKRRNAKLIKAYICIFVCFATKAVHIELVADLSSESFMGALKRFMARRGKVSCMYSDNGTNFVGAARELNELHDFFVKEQIQHKINEFFIEYRIEWKNIPPNAPHFGGLWEAAIKSAKHHMKRIIGDAALNHDEMSTVLAEIEAILNSRPISQLSSDPNDMRPLSPGHFLIGDALNSYAHPDITAIKINRLSRWQRVEQLRQHFWQRWSLEYLNQLQGRSKWRLNKGEELKAGRVVLIQKSGLAPFQWVLGRIDSVITSADGAIRSAVVRTGNGLIVRPLTKLSVLPNGVNA